MLIALILYFILHFLILNLFDRSRQKLLIDKDYFFNDHIHYSQRLFMIDLTLGLIVLINAILSLMGV